MTKHRHELDHTEQQWLQELRRQRRARRKAQFPATPAAVKPQESDLVAPRGLGAQLADAVAGRVGSWPFVLTQTVLLLGWIAGNVWFGARTEGGGGAWDPYPFILLNLLLSFQAAYTAPIIMMSQNRLSEVDRRRAEQDYQVNVKAELEIELLHQKIDLLREQELLALTRAVAGLAERLERKIEGSA